MKLYRKDYARLGKRGPDAPRCIPKRPASIDCKHVCPVCGMGYEDEGEAMQCCRKVALCR